MADAPTVTGDLDLPRSSGLSPERTVARFVAGTIIAQRYRVVTLLGRGGMGEVYKADDLTLGQPVALKFMPDAIAISAPELVRFHGEVRIARRVSHPNVCRVYDVGEVDGLHFLTMEFIDGEDLASLLRRIGRLPGDKAADIAREICTGLAAAHDAGIIHRDLKPANVMIDGRGHARLTDFGVAALAKELRGADVVGTPAYMAPEQLVGGTITAQTDLYSLGLVLYELFTGKRAVERHDGRTTPATPSSWVTDLDPLVERTILRCLESDPASRPSSAIQVAAALPGGDPLYAALAAGETPSPQMVAAAGSADGMRPALSLACFVAILVALLGGARLGDRIFLAAAVPLELPPDVLANKAHDIIARVGYTDSPVGTAFGFAYDEEYVAYRRTAHTETPARGTPLKKGDPSAVYFWYRESPRPLLVNFEEQLQLGVLGGGPPRLARVSLMNPPPFVPGMRSVSLDLQGRLLELEAIPSEFGPVTVASPTEWGRLLSAAGLDAERSGTGQSTWTPSLPFDEAATWTARYPERPDTLMRIDAASYRNRPVAFRVSGPWHTKPRTTTSRMRPAPLFLIFVVIAAFLAWTNIRAGRGDIRGAVRLALACFALRLVGWALSADHVASGESVLYRMASSQSLTQAMTVYLIYLAFEPYVRRRWPQALISWSRALAGRLADPLVGRDLAIGTALAALWFLFAASMLWVSGTSSATKELDAILSVRHVIGLLLLEVNGALELSTVYCFTILLFRVILRREWAVMMAAILLAGVPHLFDSTADSLGTAGLWGFAISATLGALMVVALFRFGLTAVAALWLVHRLLVLFPTTLNWSTWYAGMSIFTLAVVAGLSAYACYTAVGRHRLLSLLPAPR